MEGGHCDGFSVNGIHGLLYVVYGHVMLKTRVTAKLPPDVASPDMEP